MVQWGVGETPMGNNKVTVLEKIEGVWSQAEVNALVGGSMVEVEQLGAKPNRIVVMNKPLRKTISDSLGHSNFTEREVDYRNRWA